MFSNTGRVPVVPRYAWIAAIAIAIGAVTVILASGRSGSEIEALVSVARSVDYRVVEPRLSGGFPHKPLRRAVRPASPGAYGAALSSPHARGLAHLLTGDSERATRTLERAAEHGSGDAGVLTDLAAARYERALLTDQPSDLASAFTILTHALDLDPGHEEALFDRALVLERLHLQDDAALAWRTYLQVDGTSPWAVEARAHLSRLEHRAAAPSVEERRTSVEEKILAEWAAAVLANDLATAGSALARTADASPAAPDGTARATLERIRSTADLRPLALAHRDYAEARRLYLKARNETACAAMISAATALDGQHAPLAARAWVHAATVSHYLGRSDEALGMLDRVEILQRGYDGQRPLATGHLWWMRGLIAQARGEFDDALRAYLAARPHIEAAGEASAMAGISTVLSETYRHVGDMESAWAENLRALKWLRDPSVTYSRRQVVQNDTALLAIAQGHPRLAELVADRVRTRALDAEDPIFETLALLTHARALMSRSRYAAARRELETAAERVGAIPRDGSTKRLAADIMLARAEALTATEPAAAVRYVRDAATELRKLKHRSRLPRLYLLGGRAWSRLGNESAAEGDWQAGLAEFETQRDGLTNHRDRSTFTDAGRALFDELVALAVARGRDADALAIVRRARMAGVMLPVASRSSSPSPAGTTPRHDVVLVEYYILSKELLIWTTSDGATRFARVPVDGARLATDVERFAARVRDCGSAADCEQKCGQWFDLLLRPAGIRAGELWIAPDMALHRVPFAALYDRQRRRFVAEDHAVTILLGPAAPAAEEPLRSALIAVAPSAVDQLPELQAAEREAAIAARAFSTVTFLRGPEATPARFLDEIGRHDAVHFAGHALLDERHPGRSALRLPGGPLHAEELNGRSFARTRLVILAGCDTARGTVTTAGPLSYARAFADAGVPQVIGSLWPVNDAASAAFFSDFYAALKNGETPAMAMATAQRRALSSRRAAPQAWATYQLYVSAARAKKEGSS